jgi:hypothetical protein
LQTFAKNTTKTTRKETQTMTGNSRPSARAMNDAHDVVVQKYGHLFGYKGDEEDNSPYRPRWMTSIRMMRSFHAISTLLILEKTPEGNTPYAVHLDPNFAHLMDKFPEPRTCPRWYGKSEGWWAGTFVPDRPTNVCTVRFTTFEAWDAMIKWIGKKAPHLVVSPHLRSGKTGIVRAFPYEIRMYHRSLHLAGEKEANP